MFSRLAITAGEPAGIGPDLILQLAVTDQWVSADTQFIVIADRSMLEQRSHALGLSLEFVDYEKDLKSPNKKNHIIVYNCDCDDQVSAGKLNANNAQYVLNTLSIAAKGCLSGEFDAMVTAPLHKGIINDADIPFTGHTEFLADLTNAELPVMMLAAGDFRVALATTHLPLSEVSHAITKSSLEKVIRILNHDLIHKFGIENPHILVCGLNPHAGEGGHLGMEEINTIEPVVNKLKNEGINLTGPLPADTLFTAKYLDNADAVLSMFHDQGLPVLKYAGFGKAINVTLGLPIIRTSVDHGTALDLAGTGKASTGSFIAAIDAAKSLVHSTAKKR